MTRPDKPFGTTVAPQALRQAWVAVAAGLPLAAGGAFGLASHGGAEHAAVAALLAACMVLPAGVLVLRGFQRLAYPHARLGMCNIVTLMRGAVIAALAGLLAVPDALAVLGYPLAALAALVLALDGVDGWAARRAGLASHFGARLDVETDVAFALVMAALAVALDKVGPWFLLLGLLRPIFFAGRACLAMVARPACAVTAPPFRGRPANGRAGLFAVAGAKRGAGAGSGPCDSDGRAGVFPV